MAIRSFQALVAKKGMPRRSGAGVHVIDTCYDKHANADQLQSIDKICGCKVNVK